MSSRILSLSALVVALALPAMAQVGSNGVYGGVGTVTAGPWDVNILAGGVGGLGVQWFPPTGTFFVSRRGTALSEVAPHSLIEMDQTGALVATYPQGPGITGGAWGHRDGATDAYASSGLGMTTFWGDELGIHAYDHTLGTPVYVTGPHTVWANNGPQTVTFPFTAALAPVGALNRALEYDPAGDSGNGSFWTCNFGSALVEVSLTGTVLRNFPVGTNPPPAWSAYGLAMNLQTNRLWVNSSPAGAATTPVPAIAELDPATGIFTGRRFLPAGNVPPPGFLGSQGGLCYIENRVGPTYGPANSPPFSELAALSQATPDYVSVHRLDLAINYDSALEARLEASVAGAAFTTNPQSWTPGATMSFQYVQSPLAVPSPALCIANIAVPGIAPAPLGDTFNVAEFYVLNNFSNPVGLGVGVPGVTLGDGFNLGGLLAPDLILITGGTQPTIASPPFMVPSLGGPGTQLTLQGAFISDIGTLVATNRLTLTEL